MGCDMVMFAMPDLHIQVGRSGWNAGGGRPGWNATATFLQYLPECRGLNDIFWGRNADLHIVIKTMYTYTYIKLHDSLYDIYCTCIQYVYLRSHAAEDQHHHKQHPEQQHQQQQHQQHRHEWHHHIEQQRLQYDDNSQHLKLGGSLGSHQGWGNFQQRWLEM